MDILGSTEQLVQKEGVYQLNIYKLAMESQIDINAILRYFGTFEGGLKAFLHQSEYRYNFRPKDWLK